MRAYGDEIRFRQHSLTILIVAVQPYFLQYERSECLCVCEVRSVIVAKSRGPVNGRWGLAGQFSSRRQEKGQSPAEERYFVVSLSSRIRIGWFSEEGSDPVKKP